MDTQTPYGEIISAGDDYYEIADAIHLVPDWRARDTARVLREAGRTLLACDWRGWTAIAPEVERHQRFWRYAWPDELKDQVRERVGVRVWTLIERRL